MGICPECVYLTNILMEDYTKGSIICLKCKEFMSFTVQYHEGQATFCYRGMDHDKCLIYSMTETTFAFKKGSVPTRVHCNSCKSQIPKFMLKHNPYTKQYHGA